MTDVDAPLGRLPFTRLGLVRINLYWLALSGLWAAIAIQLAPVIGTHLVCPAGTDGAACALLPIEQLTPLVGDIRLRPEVALGFMGLVGAVVAFVVQPISAALSDSTRTRFGRRRPWILVGTTLDVLFLLALSMSQTFLAFAILGWLLQLSSNLAQGPYQGYVPDTAEACGFEEALPDFSQVEAVVLGVSILDTKSKAKFATKYKLTFPLLADEDHAVSDKYGVWQEKRMYGRTYMGIARVTYLIDGDGKVAQRWDAVKVENHAAEVLEAVTALGAK